jgi:hypothetical protein
MWSVSGAIFRSASAARSPEASSAGASLRPEPADVLWLGRRLLRLAVAVARADEAPTPARLLAEHLGPQAPSLPVVSEGWAVYEHVNVQGAIDRWIRAASRSSTLIGITNFQDLLHEPWVVSPAG